MPTSRVTATPIAEAFVAGGTAAAPTTVRASGNVKLTTTVSPTSRRTRPTSASAASRPATSRPTPTANTTSKAWVGDFDEDAIDDNGVVIEAGTTVALFADTDIKTYVKAHADSIGLVVPVVHVACRPSTMTTALSPIAVADVPSTRIAVPTSMPAPTPRRPTTG